MDSCILAGMVACFWVDMKGKAEKRKGKKAEMRGAVGGDCTAKARRARSWWALFAAGGLRARLEPGVPRRSYKGGLVSVGGFTMRVNSSVKLFEAAEMCNVSWQYVEKAAATAYSCGMSSLRLLK